MLSNPLLAVLQATWLETAVCAEAEAWVPCFPPHLGEPEGTMRGCDPALPHPIRRRCDVTRDWSARLFAFAVPNQRAVEACRRAVASCRGGPKARIVEVGAGLGYWKRVLEDVGKDHAPSSNPCHAKQVAAPTTPLRILAMDRDPPRLQDAAHPKPHAANPKPTEIIGTTSDRPRGPSRAPAKARRKQETQPSMNEYHGRAPAWSTVRPGGPEDLHALSASEYPVLMLCYPPPSLGATGPKGTCMGSDALEAFGGNVVLVVGEVGGDTGSPKMEAILSAGWDMVEEVELPCFPSTASLLMVFVRKGCNVRRTSRVPDSDADHVPIQNSGETLPAGSSTVKRCGGQAVPDTGASSGAARPDRVQGEVNRKKASLQGWNSTVPMYRCSSCGQTPADGKRLHLCRLTRAARFCSDRCLGASANLWRASLQARHIHLGGLHDNARAFRDKKTFRKLAIQPLGPSH